MIVLSIAEKNQEDINAVMKESHESIEIFEVRLDYLSEQSLENINKVVSYLETTKSKPIIYTLRSKRDGGLFSNNKDIQFETIRSILKLKPDFIDMELGMSSKYYKILNKEKGDTKLICSYHNLKKTLSLYGMRQIIRKLAWTHADILKLVTTANEIKDNLLNLQMIEFVHKRYKKKAICFCMGEKGVLSRAITESLGGFLTFACDEEKNVAPGQISAESLINIKKQINI